MHRYPRIAHVLLSRGCDACAALLTALHLRTGLDEFIAISPGRTDAARRKQPMKMQAHKSTLVCTLSRSEGSFLGVATPDAGCDPNQDKLWRSLLNAARKTAQRRGLRGYEIYAGSRHGGHMITCRDIE